MSNQSFLVAAWAEEQVALLRAGRSALLDMENIAEEIAAVGASQKHALRHRCAVLLAHLLAWRYQPRLRGNGWLNTIVEQRDCIEDVLEDSPSLRRQLDDPAWYARVPSCPQFGKA
ncbi:DUF29 domain-containing protein [Rugamonas fusca]|uniref:DUF29 domain-containing protein n=1 Tax=Rugamonas fusca TaxID=2758568 RepID=UPI001E5F698B|nr:DUF29 domain-containing protein [Rugamonas fusca]